jgi:3-oxoacyl-(acyl-carrier-protein) synthase/NAD(P)-dependent dehydrogenase (short-subunit alcohol dehydrogenase family)/acyl carrier protein
VDFDCLRLKCYTFYHKSCLGHLGLNSSATYILTGGFGGLGQVIISWLLDAGAGNIVVIQRRPVKAAYELIQNKTLMRFLTESTATRIVSENSSEFESDGIMYAHESGKLLVYSCDVGDREKLVSTLCSVKKNLNSAVIHGIFHCAGVLLDSPISTQTAAMIHTTFSGKVDGAKNLLATAELLGFEQSLKYFVVFSSLSSVLGNVGQSHYAAANSALDAIIERRHALGRPALSIQWGPWSDQGMASSRNVDFASVFGIESITNDVALRVLHDLLLRPLSHPVVVGACFDWTKLIDVYVRKSAKDVQNEIIEVSEKKSDFHIDDFATTFLKYGESKAKKYNLSSGNHDSDFLNRLEGKSEAEIQEIVKERISLIASKILHKDVLSATGDSLADFGLDSLSAVELRNTLEADLGIRLPATALLDYPSIDAIGEFILSLIHEALLKESSAMKNKPLGLSRGPSEVFSLKKKNPIAILGLSCRLPTESNSPEAFWKMLEGHTDCIDDIPLTRFNVDALYDANPDISCCSYVREGAFIKDAEFFDNQTFKVSKSELAVLDPQQRLILEVAYEAAVSAGFNQEELRGLNVGVYMGCCNFDWHYMDANTDPYSGSPYSCTGGSMSLISNRVSYALSLRGPSFTVDTACSSSLVALDNAVRNLRQETCDYALVGGVNLILSPQLFIGFCKTRLLSPTCRCRTFDAAADGYARGEGAGCIFLCSDTSLITSKYPDAKLRVFGYILGTAINHVGRGSTLTAPNGPAQQKCIREALIDARLSPQNICYLESHGTGTALGDPVETGAIASVFSSIRKASSCSPLILGALKTNIGHLEGAAGIAGLLKLTLALGYRRVPPNLHFKKLNPHIDFLGMEISIPTKQSCDLDIATTNSSQPTWLPSSQLYGGVSSFGFGGANAHAIIASSSLTSENFSKLVREQMSSCDIMPNRCWTPWYKRTAHPLLGRREVSKSGTRIFATCLRKNISKLFGDHSIAGVPLLPAVAVLDVFAAAICAELHYSMTRSPHVTVKELPDIVATRVVRFKSISLVSPFEVQSLSRKSSQAATHLRVLVSASQELALIADKGQINLTDTLNTNESTQNTSHLTAMATTDFFSSTHGKKNHVDIQYAPASLENVTTPVLEYDVVKKELLSKPPHFNKTDCLNMYAHLRSRGYQYGTKFQTLSDLYYSDLFPGTGIGRLKLEVKDLMDVEKGFLIHPGIFDGALHAGLILCSHVFGDKNDISSTGLFVPAMLENICISRYGGSYTNDIWTLVTVDLEKQENRPNGTVLIGLTLFDVDWKPFCSIQRVYARPLEIIPDLPKQVYFYTKWIDHNLLYEDKEDQPLEISNQVPIDALQKFVWIFPYRMDEELQQHLIIALSPYGTCTTKEGLVTQDPNECVYVYLNLSNKTQKINSLYDKIVTEAWDGLNTLQLLLQKIKKLRNPSDSKKSNQSPGILTLKFVLIEIQQVNDCKSSDKNFFSQSPLSSVLKSCELDFNIHGIKADLVLATMQIPTTFELRSATSEIYSFVQKLQTKPFSGEKEVIFDVLNNKIFVPREAASPVACIGHMELHLLNNKRGALSQLSVQPLAICPFDDKATVDEVQVRVRSVGLNFRDVLNVMGLYPGNPGKCSLQLK